MKSKTFATVLVLAGALSLNACAPSTEGDEAAIRAINKKWEELIVAKDVKAITAIYAEDGQFLPPNAPKAVGHAAIEQGWTGFMAIPNVALTFGTEKFVFSKSGDLAVEIATYKFSSGEGAAAMSDTGKAIVTWTKRDGKWFVLTDMFSSDAPPPPAPPAAPAAPADPAAPAAPATPGETPAPATPPAQ